MEDDQILEEINYYLKSKRPGIIQVSLFSRFHNLSEERVRSVMDTMSFKSDEEDQMQKVYCIHGITHNAQLNNKVKVMRIANELDVDKVKSALESVVDCVLYGAYKGTLTNPAKLNLVQFEEETIKPCVTLPAAYSPDGNCKSRSIRPRAKAAGCTSGASTSGTSAGTASTPAATHPNITQSKKAKSNAANKKSTNSKSQPKLFFGQSTSKKSVEGSASQQKPTDCPVKEDVEVNVDKDSPSKSSDKENAAKEKSKPKRSRVQMFSSSEESDTDVFDKSASPKAKKVSKKSGDHPPTKSVINKTGLALDPDDLQNESDEELSDTPTSSNKQKESQGDAEKPKRKRRRKRESGGDGDGSSEGSKSKQSNFGSVKAGEVCNSMKYVDKTYLDKEGFLVTEKVMEEVPLSERTTPADTKSEQKTTSRKVEQPTASKKSKPVPKQQSSLLSFFKRK